MKTLSEVKATLVRVRTKERVAGNRDAWARLGANNARQSVVSTRAPGCLHFFHLVNRVSRTTPVASRECKRPSVFGESG